MSLNKVVLETIVESPGLTTGELWDYYNWECSYSAFCNSIYVLKKKGLIKSMPNPELEPGIYHFPV